MESSFSGPALVIFRLLLGFAGLEGAFQHDYQLSSPLTSHLRLQEGIYLFRNNIDPYSGGSFYHSPLYLSAFSTVFPTSRTGIRFLWTICDLVGAWSLVSIWRSRSRVHSSGRDFLIAALYLLNPYLLLPNLALSTASIENMLQLLTLSLASQGKASASLLTVALLVQLSLTSILVLPPLLMLLYTGPASSLASPKALLLDVRKLASLAAEFMAYTVVLCLTSTLVSGNWTWITKTWGVGLRLLDLTPNPGLWWYFFTEMFDHFRPFFLMVFSAHILIYVVPLCIKFQHDPLYACFLVLGFLAIFKPYLTLADPGLFLSMASLFPETYSYLRHPIVTVLLHLHASLLLPLFNSLWLAQGTGNANFFYASTLVFGLANSGALIDATYAGLRVAIGEKAGWEVVQE